MNNLSSLLLLLLGLNAAVVVHAEQPVVASQRSIQILGRPEVTVTQPTVSIGDMADVFSARASDDSAVIALKKITVDQSPRAGETLTVSAMTVVEKMGKAGVDLRQVGYSLPRTMLVRRASRTLSIDEIRKAIDEFAKLSGRDLAVKNIAMSREIQVPPEVSKIEARPFALAAPGRMGFTIAVQSPTEPEVKFDVEASVEQWAEVPVARRSFGKGEIVRPEDVMMARMNLGTMPRDAVLSGEKLVGLSTSADLTYGEIFRKNKLTLPIAVEKDSSVVVLYRQGALQATLRGIALEAGAVGQEIKVRNESSKKIVYGRVKEGGMIEVQP